MTLRANEGAVRRLAKVKTKELGRAFPTLKRGNRGIVRSKMPQIDSPATFVRWLKSEHGLPYSLDFVSVGTLKPTQKHFDTEKVRKMVENARAGKFPDIDAPIVVSHDRRILDGHHRWAALRVLSPSNKMGIYTTSTTIEKLIKLARKYGAQSESLHKKTASAFIDAWSRMLA